LAERTRPDLALRDVAGMLRSFDYAARYETYRLPVAHPAITAADEWAQECRAAFLRAYRAAARSPDPGHDRWERLLLRALEVDKALYEVVYETWNRPDWVGIPLGGLRRLLRG
jgi:maltokinase